MYLTRKLKISSQKDICDTVATEAGKLYSTTVKFFWRTVNRKGLWLKKKSLMKLFTSNKMHAHSADASVEQFFNALSSWREARKTVPEANPPRKLKKYTAVTWKKSAIFIRNSQLILSNGKIT
jgi:putative transposase